MEKYSILDLKCLLTSFFSAAKVRLVPPEANALLENALIVSTGYMQC